MALIRPSIESFGKIDDDYRLTDRVTCRNASLSKKNYLVYGDYRDYKITGILYLRFNLKLFNSYLTCL